MSDHRFSGKKKLIFFLTKIVGKLNSSLCFAFLLFSIISSPTPLSAQSRDIRSATQYGTAEGDLRLKFEFYHDMWSERDVKHGKYSEWTSNDRLRLEGFYFDGKQDSVWQYWYLNGNIKEQSQWNDGVRNGKTAYFDKKGRQQYEYSFVAGTKEGLSLEFFKNGRVKRIAQYHHNQLHGNVTNYSRKGIRKDICLFEGGKRVRPPKEKKEQKKEKRDDENLAPGAPTDQKPSAQPKTPSTETQVQEKGTNQAWENTDKKKRKKEDSKVKAEESKPKL